MGKKKYMQIVLEATLPMKKQVMYLNCKQKLTKN